MAKRVTKRMLDAARLLAAGEMNVPAIAKEVGVSEASVYRWMHDDDVMNEYRRCMRQAQIRAVAKASRVLEKQMDSDAGSGFLAQNAANAIMNRSYAAVMGEDKQEITVHITGGMPPVGMPALPTEED